MSSVTCQVSHIRCHMSGVTCHLSCVMCHVFTATWSIDEIGPVTVYIVNPHKSATFDCISTKILTDSGPFIKLLIGGLIRDAPDPPNPPYGGLKYFWGGYDWKTMLTPIKSNIIGKLLISNILWVILGESPDPPDPLSPYTPIGGPNRGAWMRGVI